MSDPNGSSRHEWYASETRALLPRLMGTALRLARDRTDAEDLVADAVAAGWSKLDSLQDPAALGPWLSRILTNAFISGQRGANARAETEPYVEASSDAEGSFSLFERLHQPFLLWQTNPEREFLNRLLREDLEEAIDALPEPFRLAIVLVDVEGLSYQEASESLDAPVGTIRSRLARGRSRLQQSLWTQAVDAGYRPGTEAGSSRRTGDVTRGPGTMSSHAGDKRGTDDE
jgi:RNA polymerase sigma-70 factor (ECF subfamily)